ncbi:hypothetical protein NPIL_251691, partial [Nephila pilipes]
EIAGDSTAYKPLLKRNWKERRDSEE